MHVIAEEVAPVVLRAQLLQDVPQGDQEHPQVLAVHPVQGDHVEVPPRDVHDARAPVREWPSVHMRVETTQEQAGRCVFACALHKQTRVCYLLGGPPGHRGQAARTGRHARCVESG